MANILFSVSGCMNLPLIKHGYHKDKFSNGSIVIFSLLKIKATIIFIIIWDFSMFYQIFLSPQVEWCVIVTYKHGIYELPYELRNHLRLRILRNQEISGKFLIFIEWWPVLSLPAKMKILLILVKSSWEREIKPFPLCAMSREN